MSARIVDEATIDIKIAAAIAAGGGGLPYLVYIGALTQKNDLSFILNEYQNTLGVPVSVSRDALGDYSIDDLIGTPDGKIFCPPFGDLNNVVLMPLSGDSIGYYTVSPQTGGRIKIFTVSDLSYTPVDMTAITGDGEYTLYIEIRVYP